MVRLQTGATRELCHITQVEAILGQDAAGLNGWSHNLAPPQESISKENPLMRQSHFRSQPYGIPSFVIAGKLALALHVAGNGRHRAVERGEVSSGHIEQPGVTICIDDE
jgi:hypothetical protein